MDGLGGGGFFEKGGFSSLLPCKRTRWREGEIPLGDGVGKQMAVCPILVFA